MSERTTGATDETPETPEQCIAWSIESETGYDPIWCRGLARESVQSLASNGYVIARAADVLQGNQRAIDVDDLRALLKAAPLGMRPSREAEAFLNRIKAIADGGAK